MSRYIDADAFKEKYGDYYAEEGTTEGFIGTVGRLIDKAPTVLDTLANELAEGMVSDLEHSFNCGYQEGLNNRPKGKWESRYWVGDAYYHVCSECKMHIRENEFDNYCPNCGADMRGKKND